MRITAGSPKDGNTKQVRFSWKMGISTGGPGAMLAKCPREKPAIHTWRGHERPFPLCRRATPHGGQSRPSRTRHLRLPPVPRPGAPSLPPRVLRSRRGSGHAAGRCRAVPPSRPDPTRALTAPPHAIPGAAPSRLLGSGGSRTGPSGPARDPHAGQLFLPPSLPTDVPSERGFCLSSRSPHLARRVCFPNSPDGAVGSGRFVLLFPSLQLRSHTSRGP